MDHMDIFLKQLIQFNLNNTINVRLNVQLNDSDYQGH